MVISIESLKFRNRVNKVEIRQLIETNLYIFKENVKVLLLSLVEQVWSRSVKTEQLDNIILKAINKSPIEEIVEVDDENQNTESMSLSATNKVS